MSQRRPHPDFDDRGTLHWHTRWRSALAQARAEGKLLFVEVGRELCSQCRALVEAVVPRPEIAALLQEHFVALAADVDDCDDEVIDVAGELEAAYTLPFVLFADAEGRFLAGSAGAVEPGSFLETLQRLVVREG